MKWKIKFRVMGYKYSNWSQLAAFDTYEEAQAKIESIPGGYQVLEIRKVWVPK